MKGGTDIWEALALATVTGRGWPALFGEASDLKPTKLLAFHLGR